MLSYGQFYSNKWASMIINEISNGDGCLCDTPQRFKIFNGNFVLRFHVGAFAMDVFFAPFGCYMGSCMFTNTLYIVDNVLACVSIWVVIFNSRIISCINSKLSAGCHAMSHKTVLASSWPSYPLDGRLSFCTKCKIRLELPFGWREHANNIIIK